MTLSQLQEKIEALSNKPVSEDAPVTVCDLTDDSDESYNFHKVKDIDTIRIKGKEIVVLIFES